MRFSVDAHAIGRHLTGNEVYIRNLLNGFAALDTSSEFIAYVSAMEASGVVPERFTKRKVSGNPFLRLGAGLSLRLIEDRPDLLHVQYTAPIHCRAPIIVTVHDISFLEHPSYFSAPRSFQLQVTVARTVRRAERILTPSEFSRRAILGAYDLNEERVVVIPNAVSAAFRPLQRKQARSWVENRFAIGAPYMLTVGDLQPRKNQIGLIHAFEELIRAYPHLPHLLVIVGKDTWHAGAVKELARKSTVRDRIHFTGFVTDYELVQLYGACDLFVFPSFYEGFGLPILEAMACARAVACSNTTAMPEVADSAAILFDPHSTSSIMRALRDLLLNTELRERMERLGLQRAARFSWASTAKKTLDVYYEVAGARAARPERVSVVRQ